MSNDTFIGAEDCVIQDSSSQESYMQSEEDILNDLSETLSKKAFPESIGMSMVEYLSTAINMNVPKAVIIRIMLDRGIYESALYLDVEQTVRRLCTADLCVWACMGVGRVGETRDTDNGWTHAEGGYTLTAEDKRLLLKRANQIYEECGEKPVGKSKVTIRSYGISKAHKDAIGNSMPHVIKYL